MHPNRFVSFNILGLIALGSSGCSGIQSTLDPAGTEAEAVAHLFWVMLVGAVLIWLAVMAGFFYASRHKRRVHSEETASRLILWGGAVFPVVVLTALLVYGLALMPQLRPWNVDVSADAPLRIEVVGEQFWWRVIYHRPGEEPVVSANEVRLPVGERVAFTLKSADVVHAFWIPTLGGKMDMIPGRENTLSLQATRAGIYRGPCVEFCGTSHALMAFAAVAMEPADFDAWLALEAVPSEAATAPGLDAFLANGCHSCHAINGTEAAGTVGPDLSHIGSRQTIGAGILPNTEETIARMIREPDVVKPGIRMPAFHALPDDEITRIAAYLKGLE
jgi:cytochrome c oxidase subunit 2